MLDIEQTADEIITEVNHSEACESHLCESHTTQTPKNSAFDSAVFGCPCCSPVIGLLNDGMAVTDATLSSVQHWQLKGPALPEVSQTTQILVNAKVYTVDQSFSTAEAIAINDGKILAVGKQADLVAEHPDADVIDCGGKTILPGFIEPHMHFLPIATIGQFENVGPFKCDSIDEVIKRLSEMATASEEGDWIMARQIDPSLQAGAENLNRHILDQASTDRAIYVYNASLHFAYCNTKALELAGITSETPDELGSSFGRDEDGTPNGVLQGGRTMSMVVRHNPKQADYDLAEACLDVCTRANTLGITTMVDQATGLGRGVQELDIYKALADSNRMSARLRYSLSYALQERWDKIGVKYGDGNEMVRATGWKIVSDGSNQGRSGLQREPYLGSDEKGVAYVEAEELKIMVEDRARKGWPLVIHANGDQAIDNTLDAYENAFDKGLLDKGPYRIEHCSILHDEHIERIAKMGLSPSFLIGHVYYWGQAMRDSIFGPEKAELLDRTAACEAKGIRWTLHSDEPVTEMGPLRCIENAVTRKLWREPESKLAAHEAVSVQAAVRSLTIDAAWQCHSDHEVGSLEAGKYADFVILDQDPMTTNVDEIQAIQILETWMGGRKVYSSKS